MYFLSKQKQSVLLWSKEKPTVLEEKCCYIHTRIVCLRVWVRVKTRTEDTDTTSFEFWNSISQIIIKLPLLVFFRFPQFHSLLALLLLNFYFYFSCWFYFSLQFNLLHRSFGAEICCFGESSCFKILGMYQNCIFLASLLFQNASSLVLMTVLGFCVYFCFSLIVLCNIFN